MPLIWLISHIDSEKILLRNHVALAQWRALETHLSVSCNMDMANLKGRNGFDPRHGDKMLLIIIMENFIENIWFLASLTSSTE